jgi:hypothetical protein
MVTQQSAAVEINEVVTEFIKTMIKISDDPRQVFVGIHNAFVFGEIFDEIGFDFSEEQLGQLFNGIEMCQDALKKMEEEV